jgi:DNA-binding transcriptional regulator WhiA
MRENFVAIPYEINSEIAELIGAHIGDGNSHVRKSDYRLIITCDAKKDKEYVALLADLFYKNFKIKPKVYIRSRNNSITLVVRSKKLHKYYTEKLDMPVGRKTNIDIPSYILAKNAFLIACIRGIFDTDGSISIQKMGKYEYPFIAISTTSENLAKTLIQQLKILGLKPFISITRPGKNNRKLTEFSVRVKGFDEVIKWKEIIGSNNPRNSLKLNKVAHGQS